MRSSKRNCNIGFSILIKEIEAVIGLLLTWLLENLISLSKVFAGAANRRENARRVENISIELPVTINQFGGNTFTERVTALLI